MATFYLGQRVRIRKDANAGPDTRECRGREAVIVEAHDDTATWDWDWGVRVPGVDGTVYARAQALEPLIDPKAEEFIASIKKLKPYEEPKREAEELQFYGGQRQYDRKIGQR